MKTKTILYLAISILLAAGNFPVKALDSSEASLWTSNLLTNEPFGLAGSLSNDTIPVPAGYGRYCSIMYGDGAWAFGALPGQSGAPCEDLRKSRPGGVIMRAGLWSHNGNNNVLRRCDGDVGIWRDKGDIAILTAYNTAAGKKNCIFVVSPTHLPIFSAPYGKTKSSDYSAHQDVGVTNVHSYDFYSVPISVSQFGQTPVAGHPDAHSFDRKGRQLCKTGTAAQCCPNPSDTANCRAAGCHINQYHGGYDWIMPAGKPIRAVAPGKVIMSRRRDVSAFNCSPTDKWQQEIFIMHTVSAPGGYGEKFMSYYAHMRKRNVQTGDTVVRGQVIGEAGTTGCSTANHLHFGTARMTNTSGFLEYPHQIGGDCGDNSLPVIIDPFGWAAPKHVDPYAWISLGNRTSGCTGPNPVSNPGAFSVALWKEGSAPPNKN